MSFAFHPLLPAAQLQSTASTAGYIKVYLAGTWQLKPVKVWDGSQWLQKPVKFWSGSQWVLA